MPSRPAALPLTAVVLLGLGCCLGALAGCGARSSLRPGGTEGGGGSASGSSASGSSASSSSGSACDQITAWSRRLGSPEDLESTDALVTLPSCETLAGGVLRGEGDGAEPGLFVRRLDPAGQTLLERSWGGSDGNLLRGVGSDSAGRIVVAGQVWGSINFGGLTLSSAGQWDIVLASFEPDGSHRWSLLFGGPGYHEATELAVSPDGRIFLAGEVAGPISFGGSLLQPAGIWDLALASFDNHGSHRYSRLIGGPDLSVKPHIALAPDGELWLAGWFDGTLAVEPVPLGPSLGNDGYLLRLDAEGTALEALHISGAGSERVEAVAAVPAGGAVLAGRFTDSLSAPGLSLSSQDDGDAFVIRVDAAASVLWGIALGGAGNQRAVSVAVGDDGRVVVAGTSDGTITLGPDSYPSAGLSDIFVAQLTGDGEVIDVRLYGDSASQHSPRIAALPEGGYVLGGAFEGQIAFDQILTSEGGTDAFIALVP